MNLMPLRRTSGAAVSQRAPRTRGATVAMERLLHDAGTGWTADSDAALLLELRALSGRILARVAETSSAVDALVSEGARCEVRVRDACTRFRQLEDTAVFYAENSDAPRTWSTGPGGVLPLWRFLQTDRDKARQTRRAAQAEIVLHRRRE